jgi:uncharacterized lipoprotein YmbA
MRWYCLIAALALTGCAGWDAVNFGLSVANADTTISIGQRDGKTVLSAEQDGQKISGHFKR